MNTVIPELVERVDFQKDPYYADVGDYGSAGSANVVMMAHESIRTTIPNSTAC